MPVAKRLPILTWESHVQKWKDCQRCPLGQQRDRIVLARGTLPCDVLFIGEAPGASEDASGLPFWGPAGDKLQSIIDHSIPKSVSYAITNLVACFPREAKMFSDNHQPTPDEIRACRPRVTEFVMLAKPKLIVRVGNLATNWVNYTGARYADIVHPAAITRMPQAQKQMAIQKCIVILINAVEDTVQLGYPNFTIGSDEYASLKSSNYTLADIPF